MSEKYDLTLVSGSADWDLDIQLKEIGRKFGIVDECVYHHEEYLSLWKYLSNKGRYISGSKKYQEKWKKRNKKLYHQIVKKQYSAYHRLIGIFVENGKWRKMIKNFHLYIIVLFIRVLIGVVYFLQNSWLSFRENTI